MTKIFFIDILSQNALYNRNTYWKTLKGKMVNPFLNLEDKDLMLKYQTGDHMAFEVLYDRHKDKVYSYIAKRLHQKDHIEDLYQKIFMKFHKSRKLYDEKYEVLPWLYTITKSEFLDFIKKKNVNTVEFKEEYHEEISISNHEKLSIDLSKEKNLTEKEKQAISLRYLEDNDFDEIATALKTSHSNARKIISRGLKKLKDKYNGVKS